MLFRSAHDENFTFEHAERFGAVDAAESRRSKIQVAVFLALAFGGAAWFAQAAGVGDLLFKNGGSSAGQPVARP